jgi:hypothetical protein
MMALRSQWESHSTLIVIQPDVNMPDESQHHDETASSAIITFFTTAGLPPLSNVQRRVGGFGGCRDAPMSR